MNSYNITRDLIKIIAIIILYISATVLLRYGIYYQDYLLLFFATLVFFVLGLVGVTAAISLIEFITNSPLRFNGYVFFIVWAILYLLSIIITPIILLFMIIKCIVQYTRYKKSQF